MRSKLFLAFTLALAIPLAACGGDDDGNADDIIIPDASPQDEPDAAAAACNPVAGTGCEAGEKCTFVFDTYPNLGRTACAPEGTGALNDACLAPVQGEPYTDDCGKGLQCLSGACREICSTAPDSCTTDYACSRYSVFYTDNDNVGVCDPRCNPVDQTRDYDGAAACGSVDVNDPDRGCYGVPDGPFTCSPAGDPAKTHDKDATSDDGNIYINGCAPGHLAGYLRTNTGVDETPICMAYCSPVETHSGAIDDAGGLDPSCGDRAAVNNECRFFTNFLEESPSVDRNYIGICWQPDNYEYDADQDGEQDTLWPRCINLSNTEENFQQGIPDHYFWGCAPYAASLTGNGSAGKTPTLRDLGVDIRVSPEEAVRAYQEFISTK